MQSFNEQVKEEICQNISKSKDNKIIFYTILKCIGEYDLNNNYEVKTIYPSIVKFMHEYCVKNNLNSSILYSSQKSFKSNKTKYLIKINFSNSFNLLDELNYKDDLNFNSQYLIGTFLSLGSINNLDKNTHLEFRCSSLNEQDNVYKSLSFFGINSKKINYRNKNIVYLKKHHDVSDILKIMNANKSMYIMEDKKIENDFFNNYQRLVNLEVSNLKKSTKSSVEQINICLIIKSSIYFEKLNEREKLYCQIRLDNKEANMMDICSLMNEHLPKDKHISKGSLSHIIKKFKNLYELI